MLLGHTKASASGPARVWVTRLCQTHQRGQISLPSQLRSSNLSENSKQMNYNKINVFKVALG